jgi:hypothetical protein
MKKEKLFFLLLLLLILLTPACTELTRQEKNLCIKLTVQSYSYIPKCETIASCFEKTNSLFKTKLGYEQESRIYELKNHVARSWFYFNKADAEAKKIANQCAQTNTPSVAGLINQTRFYIDESFLELDLAMKKSFEIISAEEKKLTNDGIDQIKEEKIFDSLAELRQILGELKNGGTNSETYVSFYMQKAQAFKNSAASRGLNQIIENTPFWIEENEFLIPDTVLGGGKIFFPFLKEAFENLITVAEKSFYEKQNLLALQNFPIGEFMKLYSDLGGTENSALKRFADTINKTSANYAETENEVEKNWAEVDLRLAQCENLNEKISSLKTEEELYTKIVAEKISTKKNVSKLFDEQKSLIFSLREQKSTYALSLGEEAKELKQIKNRLIEVEKNAEFFLDDFQNKLTQACDEKAEEIKNEKKTFQKNEIKMLFDEVKYYSSATLLSTEKQKFFNCDEMVKKLEILNEAEKNYKVAEAKIKNSSKDCIEYLETVLKEEALFDIQLMFDDLKEMDLTSESIYLFEESCRNIKEQADKEILDDETIKELVGKINNFEATVKRLKIMAVFLDDSSLKELNEFEKREEEYQKYFDDSKNALFNKILPIKEILLERITEIDAKAEKFEEEKIIEYAQTHQKVSALNTSPAETEKDINSVMKLIIPNPFREIKKEVIILAKEISEEITYASPNFKELADKSKIILTHLPLGQTEIEFQKTQKINTVEKENFIYTSNEKSLLQRTILLDNESEVLNLKLTSILPPSTTKAIVLHDGKEVMSTSENGKIIFYLKKAGKESEIKIMIYLTGIIRLNTELKENETIGTLDTLTYSIEAQNTSESELKAELLIDLPSSKANKIEIFDELFVKKSFSFFGTKVLLKNQEFLPKQTRNFIIKIEVDNAAKYYEEALKNMSDFFASHDNETLAQEINFFLGAKNSVEKMAAEYKKNKVIMDKINANEEEARRLTLLKEELAIRIEELNKKQQELAGLGLDKEAQKVGQLLGDLNKSKIENESDIAKAFEKINKLYFDADGSIKQKANDIVTKILSWKGNATPKIEELRQKILKNRQIVEESISFDPKKAKIAFLELLADYNTLTGLEAEEDKIEREVQKENEKKFKNIYENCLIIIDYLSESLAQKSAELIKARFLQPITETRLAKLRFFLDETKNSNLSWAEKTEEVKKIEDELVKAFNYARKQAVLAFNAAINSNMPKETLIESKELIDSNKPIDALLLLSSENTNPLNALPFAGLLPILLIIIAALIIKHNFSNNKKKEDEKRGEIEKGWES